jgi:hypothetical protein
MIPASKPARETIPPFTGNTANETAAPDATDSFAWRQIEAEGMGAIADKLTAGDELELDDAIALSSASLPLLGKLVELRSADLPVRAAEGDLPVERVASPTGLKPQWGQPLADWESFCRALIATRDEFASRQSESFWYPILSKPLDQDTPSDMDFTGAEILRAIALARLVLPVEIAVRAPLASLGPKLAQVALDFGASHLGCVAPEGQMPTDPLVADSTLLEELSGSITPTDIVTS